MKTDDYWKNVIWSDETEVELFRINSVRRVWRRDGTAHDPKKILPSVKFVGGNVMLWGCFSSNGTGPLHIIDGKMNAAKYRKFF